MKQKNSSRILICSGLFSFLLLLIFFSGCLQNSTTTGPGSVPQSAGTPQENLQGSWDNKPINVTVHSAYKTMNMAGGAPKAGNIFVVIHMTIENIGSKDYSFNENAVSITGGSPLSQEIYGKLTDPLFWGSIPPHQKSTGDVVFEVPDNTQSLALTFRYHNGQESFIQEIGTVSKGAGVSSPAVPAVTAKGSQGSGDSSSLDVNIHSAVKTLDIAGSSSIYGNIYIIANMTIENTGDTPYALNENTVRITGGGPLTQKLYAELKNPLRWGLIPPHGKSTGEVVFGVKAATPSFTLTFLDGKGTSVLTQDIGTVPEILTSYDNSLLPAGLLESKDFASVVKNLDTPKKVAQYMQKKFLFETRGKCTSYTPEEFFTAMKGDCKDHSTFLSYVLAQHGYDAKMVTFSWMKDGKRGAHVVALFTDSDGKMKYHSTSDISGFTEVTSVDDLLEKERVNWNAPSIAHYKVLPAGTIDTCVE